jgi:hypothetical protein
MAYRRVGALARRIISLGARDWRDLWRAQWALIVAERLVRQRAPGQLTARNAEALSSRDAFSAPRAAEQAHALGAAVRRAARYGLFRPACLVRAIALRRMLEADGIRGAVIRVGVKQSEEGMLAHAWVELDGDVIGDSVANVREYAPLNELSVVP